MKLSKGALLLLIPGIGLFLIFVVLPIANIVEESFRLFVPGHIGASKDAPYTIFNYAELLKPAYLFYFIETLRLSLICSFLGLIVGFPAAYLVARQRSPFLRKLVVGFLIGMSALLTTTMSQIGKTIKTLKEAGVRDQVKVMVGGAPVTEDFAKECGADAYGSNAAAAVDKAKELMGIA